MKLHLIQPDTQMEHSRLHTLGIAALAAIAILGWVRQPERHLELERAARVTFEPPHKFTAPQPVPDLPVRPEYRRLRREWLRVPVEFPL